MIAESSMFAASSPHADVPPHALSPSLRAGEASAAPAFELKFLVDEPLADRLEARVQGMHGEEQGFEIHPDPHCLATGGTYRVHTLYLDTPALDVLHRTRGFRRRKHRLRRYDDGDVLHLERKSKRQDRVSKVRVAVPVVEHALLASSNAPPRWAGAEFHEDVHRLGLVPSADVTYLRRAWFGASRNGGLRITVDRHLAGGPTSSWLPEAAAERPALAPGMAVLELKFEAALPPVLQRLLGEFRLQPAALSKYRLSRTTNALVHLGAADLGSDRRA